MAQQIQLRRGTAAEWISADPVLAAGEKGIETDTLKEKTGDGLTAWTNLDYFGGTGGLRFNDVYLSIPADAEQGAVSPVWEAPRAGALVNVQGQVDITPTVNILIDLNKNGTTVNTDQGKRILIAPTELRNTKIPDVLTFAAGDLFQFVVDQLNASDEGNVGVISQRISWTEAE